MATTTENIREWLNNADKTHTHVIVVCDTFDYDDYPVYVNKDENPREIAKKYDGKNMQKIMECYSLSIDIEQQLRERRAFHWE